MGLTIGPAIELVLIVIGSSVTVEVLLWLWAYRTPNFVSLKAQVEKQGRKLESLKKESPYGKKNKKVDRLELHLKEQATRNLATLRLKQTVLMGASLFLLFRQLSRRYDGKTLAKLPFQPPSLLRKLTQRNLPAPVIDDCAFAFLYAVLNVGLRPNVGKFLSFGPTRRMLNMAGIGVQPGT